MFSVEIGNETPTDAAGAQTHVIGVDGSPQSEKIFDWACKSLPQKDRLIIYHGKTTLPFFDGDEEWFPALDRQEQQVSKLHNELIEKYSKKCLNANRECVFKTDLYDNDAELGKKICTLAEQERANSVICGSRGKSGLARMLMGSASQAVLHHCKCPVTVLRPGDAK